MHGDTELILQGNDRVTTIIHQAHTCTGKGKEIKRGLKGYFLTRQIYVHGIRILIPTYPHMA